MTRLVRFLFLLSIVIPGIASAQYMYLDTNGDGLSTAADHIDPGGPTTIDVWIRTDTNRDGSAASCVTQDGNLTINSYEFILRAVGGTVVWSGFTNHQPDFTVSLGHGESPTDYHNGQGGGTILPPGTYRLASITVSVALGTPSIGIEPSTPLSGVYLTSFGSRCSGNDFDNTLKLGLDWFDVDGAAYGGIANQPPVLTPPADMTLAEGTVAEQELHASDPEGQPVTFELVSGPTYATVTTTDPGAGTALGLVRLAPGLRDAGVTTATVSASDALLSGMESFTITVTDVDSAPSLAPVPDMVLNEGDFRHEPLSATDAGGDLLTFSLLDGPAYVTVTTTGASTGRASIAPTFADAGEADATIQVSDGLLTDTATFHITVRDPYPAHNQILCPPVDMIVPSGGVVEQRLQAVSPDGNPVQFLLVSGPPYVTVTTTSSDPSNATGIVRAAPGPSEVGSSEVTVAATDGIATDHRTFAIAVGDPRSLPDPANPLFQGPLRSFRTGNTPQSVATADLDGDGDLDIVTANLSGSVTTLRGEGDGRFERSDHYTLGQAPYSVAIGDLTGDGRPDLAVADSALDVVSVLEAIGECQFGRRRDFATPLRPAHVKLADWTGDGALDMVTSDEGANTVSLFRGRGDGTFDEPTHYPVGSDPCYSDDGDFNGDGHLDVAVANERSNNVSVLLGNGDGTFRASTVYPVGHDPRSVEVGDLDGDGILDLAVANFLANTVSVLLGVGNGTFLTHTEYPCGNSPWSLATGDLNGDDHLDLVTADVGDNTTSVLLGDGTGIFPTAVAQPAGFLARYVTLGDVNGDGSQDVIVVNEGGHTATVSLGRGDGGFEGPPSFSVPALPSTVIAGDWNGDGRQDVAVGSLGNLPGDGVLSIHLGAGDGGFQAGQVLPAPGVRQVVSADWDGDGILDLAFESGPPYRITILNGAGDGTFTTSGEYPLPDVSLEIVGADLGGDGRPDLATVVPSVGVVIFDNAGDGSFVGREPIPMPGSPSSLVIGDWNGDGLADLAVATPSPDQINVLLAAGDGSYSPAAPVPVGLPPIQLAAADFDGDNHLDLAVGVSRSTPFFFFFQSAVEVKRGVGDGTFGPSRVYEAEPHPGSIRVLDANGDGYLDLAIASAPSSVLSLRLGLGNGDFAPKQDFGGATAIDAADLDGDGRVDLAVAELFLSRVSTWINQGTFPVIPNRVPVADAGGPYTGAIGAPVQMDGTGSSDPDGDPLTLTWSFGDGASGVGLRPAHTYEGAGVFPVTLTVSDGRASDDAATTATITKSLEARIVITPEDGTFRLFASRPTGCVRLEPGAEPFDLSQVDLGTVRLRSEGTGSVEEAPAIADKGSPLLDRDRNGVAELRLCFGVEDLRLLFASITGSQDVPVSLEGLLTDGRAFRGETVLRVLGAPGFPAAFAAPNPMNPSATLFVATSRPGFLRAALYDAAGRRVRRLADSSLVPAGVHELRLDGRGDGGSELASGIYFYRVEAAEGTTMGRMTILR